MVKRKTWTPSQNVYLRVLISERGPKKDAVKMFFWDWSASVPKSGWNILPPAQDTFMDPEPFCDLRIGATEGKHICLSLFPLTQSQKRHEPKSAHPTSRVVLNQGNPCKASGPPLAKNKSSPLRASPHKKNTRCNRTRQVPKNRSPVCGVEAPRKPCSAHFSASSQAFACGGNP